MGVGLPLLAGSWEGEEDEVKPNSSSVAKAQHAWWQEPKRKTALNPFQARTAILPSTSILAERLPFYQRHLSDSTSNGSYGHQ